MAGKLRSCSNKLGQRMVEEAQLLAEEKWIIETLKKLKAQRNGLQIERLHLESMQTKILAKANKNTTDAGPSSSDQQVTAAVASDTPNNPEVNIVSVNQTNLGNPRPELLDEECNNEELNLSVTNSVFNRDPFGGMDEEEDDEDMDNCLLDMDLLMTE